MTTPSSGFTHQVRSLLTSEPVRFLLVGVINTLAGYAVFVLVQFSIGAYITYVGSLLLAHLLVSFGAFLLYRRVVFKVQGGVIVDFLRFQSVYVIPLAANLLALPLLVGLLHWNVYLAQAIIVIVSTGLSFIGHKYFSFRRRKVETDA